MFIDWSTVGFSDLLAPFNNEIKITPVNQQDYSFKWLTDDKQAILSVNVAGYDPDKIEIEFKDDATVVISAPYSESSLGGGALNFVIGGYENLDTAKAVATYKFGILTITVPRIGKSPPTNKIKVSK